MLELLRAFPTGFASAQHFRDTTYNELLATIPHLNYRLTGEVGHRGQMELALQKAQYQVEGFFERERAMSLGMVDIAFLLYRPSEPCMKRYLCAWHTEIK